MKVALPWYLLSAGDNGITIDSIVVSGGCVNVICLSVRGHRRPGQCNNTEPCVVVFHLSSCTSNLHD